MRTHNRTGRDRRRTGNIHIAPDNESTTRPHGSKKKGESWTSLATELLESPAHRVLGLAERRILDRLQIELRHHGGKDNGKLPVTFQDFHEYGVRRCSIAPAIRVLVALGLIEVTQRGRAGNAGFRLVSRYRLTYLPDGRGVPTNEWRRVATLNEARAISRQARHATQDTLDSDTVSVL
jgi:hypothetical protein